MGASQFLGENADSQNTLIFTWNIIISSKLSTFPYCTMYPIWNTNSVQIKIMKQFGYYYLNRMAEFGPKNSAQQFVWYMGPEILGLLKEVHYACWFFFFFVAFEKYQTPNFKKKYFGFLNVQIKCFEARDLSFQT